MQFSSCHFNFIVLFILIYNIHPNSISRQISSLVIVVIRYRQLFSVGTIFGLIIHFITWMTRALAVTNSRVFSSEHYHNAAEQTGLPRCVELSSLQLRASIHQAFLYFNLALRFQIHIFYLLYLLCFSIRKNYYFKIQKSRKWLKHLCFYLRAKIWSKQKRRRLKNLGPRLPTMFLRKRSMSLQCKAFIPRDYWNQNCVHCQTIIVFMFVFVYVGPI